LAKKGHLFPPDHASCSNHPFLRHRFFPEGLALRLLMFRAGGFIGTLELLDALRE
jgi:hypothetical protein